MQVFLIGVGISVTAGLLGVLGLWLARLYRSTHKIFFEFLNNEFVDPFEVYVVEAHFIKRHIIKIYWRWLRIAYRSLQ